jgi:hypothetical protein
VKNKVFFSVLSTMKFSHTRQIHVKDTWLKHVESYMFSSDADNDDNVKLSNRNDYSSNEEKQINSLYYVYEKKPAYDWYFFCDDDSFVNVNNLDSFISDNNTLGSFGQILKGDLTWMNHPEDKFNYYSGGAGFCISRYTLEKIINYKIPYTTTYCDLSTGFLFKYADHELNDSGLSFSQKPSFYNHDLEQIQKAISYHYVKDGEMYDLYKKTY